MFFEFNILIQIKTEKGNRTSQRLNLAENLSAYEAEKGLQDYM